MFALPALPAVGAAVGPLLRLAGSFAIPAIGGYVGSKYAEGQAKPSKPTVTVPPVGSESSTGSVPPAGSVPPPYPDLPPPDRNNPPGDLGGSSVTDQLVLLKAAEDMARRQTEESRKFYPTKLEYDFQDYKRKADIAGPQAFRLSQEKTFRDTQRDTILAWQKITEATINRDTQLAYGMMNLSATLGMPNPNVLTALAPYSQQATAAFKPGLPVF
jgi:hypothetical protein